MALKARDKVPFQSSQVSLLLPVSRQSFYNHPVTLPSRLTRRLRSTGMKTVHSTLDHAKEATVQGASALFRGGLEIPRKSAHL